MNNQHPSTDEASTTRSRIRPARVGAVAVIALVLAAPYAVLAGHLFSDVPAGTFHDYISNLAGAGITTGCDDGKFCPKDQVSREQMAAFLGRGLSRIGEAPVQMAHTGTGQVILGELTLTPGIPNSALSATAKQFVRASLSGSVRFTNIANCPCTLAVYLTANGSPLSQVATATTVTTASTYWPLMTDGVIAVTGPGPVTIRAVGYYVGGATTTTAYTYYGTLDAETYPFGATGGSTLSAPEAAGEPNPLAVPTGE